MSLFDNKPAPFWETTVHDLTLSPKFTAPNVGFDGGIWRYEDFADYLFEWLPEFALNFSDLQSVNGATAMRFIKRAAKTVYNTPKYSKRGEFGELILHALIREMFNSQPAISKIHYKSSANDTVKGFDAVHVVDNKNELELWLGEVKFYKNINNAIFDIVQELNVHSDRDYLRNEFLLIEGKIDNKWEHADKFREMISKRKPLDAIFKKLCIPVLLTYESPVIAEHSSVSEEFCEEIEKELMKHYSSFSNKKLPPINIHLFLLPLDSKKKLLDILHDKLEGLQK